MKTNSIWYPYSLMKQKDAVLSCDSAKGVEILLSNGKKLIDGISSWWAVIHGYNHNRLNSAAKNQLNKLSHIMLGGFETDSTRNCANKLLEITNNHFDKVFFADSGSVGCEVAIKMAYQYWINNHKPEKNRLMTICGGYHGDTFASMSVCDPNDGMHQIFKNNLMKHHFIETPLGGLNASKKNLQDAINKAEIYIKNYHQEIAALILEPIFQGASSMNFYSIDFLNKLSILCKKYDILLIFDEVATGFGRLGNTFAYQLTEIKPDILILGKGLTGGYLGLSATLATKQIYESFNNPYAAPFMHGPTFIGNPLACSIAYESICIFEEENYLNKIEKIEENLIKAFKNWSNPNILDIRIKGAIAVIEVKDEKVLKNMQAFAINNGVWIRPFSRFVYTMPAYIISEKQLKKITDTIKTYFNEFKQ